MSKIWKIPLCVGTYYDGEEVFYAIPEDKNILGIRAILHPGFIKVIDYESYEALQSQNAELIAALEFYGNIEHWTNSGRMNRYLFNQVDTGDEYHFTADDKLPIAGKRAREVLKKYKNTKT